MSDSVLLQAFQEKNRRVPVWIMRQAGRFLPEYQTIREKYSLQEMFDNPEVAAEVTRLPVDVLKVDAAILFADILTLPSFMGFEIEFEKNQGPVINNLIKTPNDVSHIHDFDDIPHIRKTIVQVKKQLPDNIPLIGFAGGPFTVLSYLIEGGSSVNFSKTIAFANRHPAAFQQSMQILTKNTIAYLKLQQDSGIQIFQLFDTWAGILRAADYELWVLPYVQEIFRKVHLPSIYYVKNAHHLLPLMELSKAEFLSVCSTVDFATDPILAKTKKGIQGNLFNGTLYCDYPQLEKEIDTVLNAARKFPKYIFNLSHGVFPDTDIEKVKFLIKYVKNFHWHR